MQAASTLLKDRMANDTHEVDPLFIQGYVGWVRIDGKGLGVVAVKDISAGTVFERCPLLVMPNESLKLQDGSELPINNYTFRWGPENKDKKAKMMALGVGGLISLYNHSYKPNADLRQDHENMLMEIIALRNIPKGEEVTIHYDCDLWFDYRE